MRVIAEVEYEVDNGTSLKNAKRLVKDTPHGSIISFAENKSVEWKKVVSVRVKGAPNDRER